MHSIGYRQHIQKTDMPISYTVQMYESELLRSIVAFTIPDQYSCSGLLVYTLIQVRILRIQTKTHASMHSAWIQKALLW